MPTHHSSFSSPRGTSEEGPAILPEGDYQLRVMDATEDTSRHGNDMIKLRFRVVNDDGSDGATVVDYLVFSDTTLWKVNAFLKACGEYRGDDSHLDLDPDEMIGWSCEATLRIETYEGRPRNKVTTYVYDDEF